MRHHPTTHARDHLPVPPPLRPVATQIEAARLPVNRALLDTDLTDDPTTRPETDDARVRRLLDTQVRTRGDVLVSGELAVSRTSHALVTLSGLRHGFRHYRKYLDLPAGHTLRMVEVYANPLPVLAHLAGDDQLAAAHASGDTYTWLADRIDVDRAVAKTALFQLLAGTGPKTLEGRLAALGADLADVLPKVATIPDVFPDAFSYAPLRLGSRGALGQATLMTNHLVHTGLAEAHHRLTEAAVPATAVALADHETVAYLVPDEHDQRFTDTLTGFTVTCVGITTPVDIT